MCARFPIQVTTRRYMISTGAPIKLLNTADAKAYIYWNPFAANPYRPLLTAIILCPDQVARTAPRKFLTIEDTGTKNPVTIARENLGAVYAT